MVFSGNHFSQLSIHIEKNIIIVTINRPDKLNALNIKVMNDLEMFISLFKQESSLKGAILTGAGDKAFVAGADISEFKDLDAEKAKMLSQKGQEIFLEFETSPKPIIALVNGYALGGGCELAMACHMRIATPNAKFAQPEINLGLLPGYGGTVRLHKIIGKSKAIEMMLTGNTIDTEEALKIGLVHHVLPQEKALKKAIDILQIIAQKSSLVVEKILKLCSTSQTMIEDYNEEANMFGSCFYTHDAKEGIDAFLNKRKPNFIGK